MNGKPPEILQTPHPLFPASARIYVSGSRPDIRVPVRDNAISKARFDFRWKDQFNLSLDPERARAYHAEAMPPEAEGTERYCSMCGPDFCAMRVSGDIRKASAAKGA